MKILWTGSDVLYLKTFPPGIRFRFKIKIIVFRILMRIIDKFAEANYAVSENLAKELKALGFKKVSILIDPPQIINANRQKHNGFNILFYYPSGKNNPSFMDWLYGHDIKIEIASQLNDRVNWIIADGNLNMQEIYPIVDFYLRPTRHDGNPRMIMECNQLGIPYYWSNNGNPSVKEALCEITKYLTLSQ